MILIIFWAAAFLFELWGAYTILIKYHMHAYIPMFLIGIPIVALYLWQAIREYREGR